MYGTLDLTDLYINQYKAFRKKTSFSTIRDICKEMGLGFNSNISDTKDSMTWLQRGDNIDFIRSIIKRSYISDESYLIGYIDYYYCFNYLDIEKELSRDISNDINIVRNQNPTTELLSQYQPAREDIPTDNIFCNSQNGKIQNKPLRIGRNIQEESKFSLLIHKLIPLESIFLRDLNLEILNFSAISCNSGSFNSFNFEISNIFCFYVYY